MNHPLHEPYPADPLGQRLCEVFPYLWQAIIAENQVSPDWKTATKYPLRPRTLWAKWQDSAQLVGVRFKDLTRYALLDIDANSPYHQPSSIREIRYALETIGITRTILIRSSFSGGFHIYIPLPVEVPTFCFATTIKQTLEAQGLEIAPGQLEIFPNCKAYAVPGTFTEYNAHRLPLQPSSGSCLLDGDCQVKPLGDGYNGLREFFQRWDVAAGCQDLELLREAIAQSRLNRSKRKNKSRTIVAEWEADLKRELEEGWTDHGQTNHLLKVIACHGHVFLKHKGDALAEYVLSAALNAPGFEEWCGHQEDIVHRVNTWAMAVEGYYWCLGDNPLRDGHIHATQEVANTVVPFNMLRSQDARDRIRIALEVLEAEGNLPEGVTDRAKAISAKARVSLRTLYKEENKDLWRSEGRSVILSSAGGSGDSEEEIRDKPRSPEFNNDGELPTSKGLMKGSKPKCCSTQNPFQIALPTQKGFFCNESLSDCEHHHPPP